MLISYFKKGIREQRGFTLVELLFVVLFMGLVFSLIFMTLLNSSNSTRKIMGATTSEIDSRTSLYIISKDIREATNIIYANSDSINLECNIDSDDEIETVYIYLQPDDGYYRLFKSVDSNTPILIADFVIDSSLFEYYADAATQIAVPMTTEEIESIKMVKINLSIDQSGTSSDSTMTIGTSVTLRNRI